MNEPARCNQCGAELPADAPHGLCAACLLKRGLDTQTVDTSGSGQSPDDFVPPTPAELALHFPDLEILQFIGRGGMGMVYKARQKRLDRSVALKILLPQIARDEAFAERFAREARTMAKLSHSNIVAVYDFGQTTSATAGPLYYFVMEYVDGLTLRELLQSNKLAPTEALAIVPQICEALQYAHDHGVVHRDIKPANILLDRLGHVKIADFGLAKLLGRPLQDFSLTGTGQVMGTPHYMAPEQIEHPQAVDHRADIYSLGVVFYQMLTGELPIGRFAPPSKKVSIDVRLDEVVFRALEREPELRYQRAGQVKTEVETILSTPSAARPHPASPADAAAIEQARGQVQGPAIGLLITGILNWVLVPVIGAVFAWVSASKSSPPIPGFANAAVVGILLAMLLTSSLMIFAALKMKRLQAYGLAIAASILGMIISPSNVIGLAIGIWSLVVLTQPEVRAAFRQKRSGTPGGTPRTGSRVPMILLTSAALVLIALAGLALFRVGAQKILTDFGGWPTLERIRPPATAKPPGTTGGLPGASGIDRVVVSGQRAVVEGDSFTVHLEKAQGAKAAPPGFPATPVANQHPAKAPVSHARPSAGVTAPSQPKPAPPDAIDKKGFRPETHQLSP